jgi:endonuclease YncB( thermonuclease family)
VHDLVGLTRADLGDRLVGEQAEDDDPHGDPERQEPAIHPGRVRHLAPVGGRAWNRAMRTALLTLLLLAASLAPARAEGAARVLVPKDRVLVDDGDGIVVRWPEGTEVVRVLGIDAPETQHLQHDIPFAQPFGEEARGFMAGAIAVAEKIELLRAADKDPYGRTLAYLFLDGKNYSVLIASARLAVENVSHFGDNGFPAEAKAVLEAAKAAGPLPFEPPFQYRTRMREVSRWMKAHGTYPIPPSAPASSPPAAPPSAPSTGNAPR